MRPWLLVLPMSGCAPALELTAPSEGDTVFEAAWVVASLRRGEVDKGDTVRLSVEQQGTTLDLGEVSFDGDEARALWFTDDVDNGKAEVVARAQLGGRSVEARLSVDVDNLSRADSIPQNAVKQDVTTDSHPPVLEPAFAELFHEPVPLEGPITTAGAEDSPFVTAAGDELFFFFTPDASVPAEKQLVDRVTGLYRSEWDGSGWAEPRRVVLSTWDAPSLDGCGTVAGDALWFCTARAGVERSIDIYVAHRDGDRFVDWGTAGARVNLELMTGELHLGGDLLTWHTDLLDGTGGIDLWQSEWVDGGWSDPIELEELNSADTDGWPWVSDDGREIWFTRASTGAPEIWRALKVDGHWQAPEKVVAPFAGEPTFDAEGNLLFTHHFWDDATNQMLEADIYIARKR